MSYCVFWSCVFLPIPFSICVLVLPWLHVVFCSRARARYTDGGRCLLLWIQIRGGIMVGAADCRSAGPWFNSGWKSWFTFLTGYDKLTNQIIQMFNNMSPIRTVITTITRKSVNMVAELDNDTAPSRILDTSGQRLEDYSTVAKAATAIAVALDTKARAAQGTVVQLKSELVQSQQSRTEAKTRADSLSVITLKPPSELGDDTLVDRMPGRPSRESLDRLGNPTFRMTLQTKSNTFDLTTRTSWTPTPQTWRWRLTLSQEDTAAFEDTMQDCLAIQTKAAEFDGPHQQESVWGIGAACISCWLLAMHDEVSNGDDSFAKVKGLISDMIKRLEAKASADASTRRLKPSTFSTLCIPRSKWCATWPRHSTRICPWRSRWIPSVHAPWNRIS